MQGISKETIESQYGHSQYIIYIYISIYIYIIYNIYIYIYI